MTTVACVLRSGGAYNVEDVARLRDGVEQHLPGARFVCFADVDVPCERVPLQRDWPGWWAKMELFGPHFTGDLLYFDLDTMIVGPLADLAAADGPVIMRDVYRPQGLQSSVMHIPQAEKAAIWAAFIANPAGHMKHCARLECWGDQGFLEWRTVTPWRRWQDICPGRVVSYKVDVRGRSVPAGASVVVFHGEPKPRDIGWRLP